VQLSLANFIFRLPFSTQPYGVHPGQCLYSVSRQFMNEFLLAKAMEHENVKMSFDCKVQMIDENASIYVSYGNGPVVTVPSKFTVLENTQMPK
jgi:hypothetical protein